MNIMGNGGKPPSRVTETIPDGLAAGACCPVFYLFYVIIIKLLLLFHSLLFPSQSTKVIISDYVIRQ